jgi:hypothetical protein
VPRPQKRLLLEKRIKRRLRALNFRGVLGYIGASLRLEVIAEIRLILLAHFFRDRFTAMLRIARVIFDAHLAHVEFGATGFANIQSAQWKGEFR